MEKSYVEVLGAALTTTARTYPLNVLGVAGAVTSTPMLSKADQKEMANRINKYMKTSLAPGVLGSVLGAVFWKKHRVLGFFGGGAVGANAYALATGDNGFYGRAVAGSLVGATGAGVGGSLYWDKHPFWGYVLGHMAGTAVASFVPGVKGGTSSLYAKIEPSKLPAGQKGAV